MSWNLRQHMGLNWRERDQIPPLEDPFSTIKGDNMSFKCRIGLHSWSGCRCTKCGKTRDNQHDKNGDVDSRRNVTTDTIDLMMVKVESGTFNFGFNPRENEPFEWTKTVSQLFVNSFYISETQITQKLWYEIMGTNPSCFNGVLNPVESISWLEAIDFCNRLSDKQGLERCYLDVNGHIQCNFTSKGYRLPTEVEWEYAARGGKKNSIFLYSGSNSIESIGWFEENSHSTTHPVKLKKPNTIGIYDMSGNVWELCWDNYGETKYLPILRGYDPRMKDHRILRGGSWKDNGRMLRLSAEGQSAVVPTLKYNDIGFRVCRSK